MWSVHYLPEVVKALRKLPAHIERLIRRKIDVLAADPHARNNNVKALAGRPGFRLRVGDWRVLYELDKGRLVVLVIRVGHRREIYER
ncbi:MAG: type II toxin-antitoxin system RelE/ParE family toxin [Alphaproteobacteria bacterium]|nr:type II toxin-antitoxin system RelE/ParE family toxin [Alphaproteobacteria bacterium]